MADVTVVEGEAPDTVYVELFDAAGAAVTPTLSCNFELRVGVYIYTIDCILQGANLVSFIPTADMVASPGTYAGRFHVDSTTYYPSIRSPFTILVRPHTKAR